MARYSPDPVVDEAVRRFVREEDPPADPHAGLDPEALRRELAALDADARAAPVVMPDYELSRAAFALKATRLAPGFLYAQLDVFLAGAAPLACVFWEWKRGAADREPERGGAAPSARAAALEAGARRILAARGLGLVPFEEAMRVLRVDDDPFYEGAFYEIRIFETLFGMGYPERQR
jgi:hypothetical protein